MGTMVCRQDRWRHWHETDVTE